MPSGLRFDIELTKTQRRIYDLVHNPDVLEVVACLSRQSGKSIIAEVLCVEYLFKVRSRIGYVVPTFSHARKVYNEIVRLIPSEWVKSQNGTTLTLETVLGSTLQFFSAESPIALRGQTFAGLLIVDECAYIADTTADGQDFFNSILFATRKARNPKVLYISTPRGKQGFFYKKFVEGTTPRVVNGQRRVHRTHSVLATIYDDDLVSEEDIGIIRDAIGEMAFRQEFLCEFLDNSISAFSSYEGLFTLDKEIDHGVPLWCGIDFSSVGDDLTIVSLMNADGEVWQYEIGGSLDEKYRRIAELLDRCKNLVICYAESNSIGEVMTNEIRKLTKRRSKIVEWTTTNESKEIEVGLLQTMIDKGNIHFEKTNNELLHELGTFSFAISKSRKVTYAALKGFHDDRVLSLMICCQAKEDYGYSNSSNYAFIKSAKARMDMR